MARVRVHQHVNPLSPYYTQAPISLDLGSIFSDPEKPLLLDIGCARGRFVLKMATAEPTWNFLGVEIREPLVTEANRLADEANLTNLHYTFCNAMLRLDHLLINIPNGRIQMVTIQFPDPWFKKRHAKRRMVTAELVEIITNKLVANGRVFIQTDIKFLANEMFDVFRKEPRLSEVEASESPFPVKTEREKAVEDKALPVYRTMFTKK